MIVTIGNEEVPVDDTFVRAFLVARHASVAVVFGDPIDADVLAHIMNGSIYMLFDELVEQDYGGDNEEGLHAVTDFVVEQREKAAEEGRLSPG